MVVEWQTVDWSYWPRSTEPQTPKWRGRTDG